MHLRPYLIGASGFGSGVAILAATLGASVQVAAADPTPFTSTGSEGAFAPTVSQTLTGGVHNFTTINIPAGVTITIDPATNQGVLDLRATGNVSIRGRVDLSGAAGGLGPAGDVSWTGTGGGDTANPLAVPFSPVPGGGCTSARHPGLGGAGFPGADGGTGSPNCWVVGAGGAFGGGGAGGEGGGGGGWAGGGGGGENSCWNTGFGGRGGGPDGGAGGGLITGGSGGNGSHSNPSLAIYDGQKAPDIIYTTYCDAHYTAVGAGGGGGSIGFDAAGDLGLLTTFRPGSGGGGGAGDEGRGGGGGGGALRIASPTQISINGQVLANGGRGGDSGGDPYCCQGGSGGGGSGGAIWLQAPSITNSGVVSAQGGRGGTSASARGPAGGVGGAGGMGRIRLDASRLDMVGSAVPGLPGSGGNAPGKAFLAPYPGSSVTTPPIAALQPSTGADGPFVAPAGSSVLPCGVKNYTSISVPAGSIVTLDPSANCGVLDLRATGDITIAGTIDLSGGQGGAGGTGFLGGGGGDTANPSGAGAAGGNACTAPNASPGGGGSGTPGNVALGVNFACRVDAQGLGGTFGGGSGGGIGGGGGGGYGGGAGGAYNSNLFVCSTLPSDAPQDLAGGSGGGPDGGTISGTGGNGGSAIYNGSGGTAPLGVCAGGGGGGGSIRADAAADLQMAGTFRPGSAGGGGAGNGGGGGGGGGGAIRISSITSPTASISIPGNVFANGGAGGAAGYSATDSHEQGGGGGGGSGGAIWVQAGNVDISGRLGAVGSAGGLSRNGGGVGGNGGLGRIYIVAGGWNHTGTFQPALGTNQPGETFVKRTATPPDAPINLAVTSGDLTAIFTWSPPASDGHSPITGYVVTVDGGVPITVAGTSYAATGFTLSGAPHTFTVAAVNALGTGPAASISAQVLAATQMVVSDIHTTYGLLGVTYTVRVLSHGQPVAYTGYILIHVTNGFWTVQSTATSDGVGRAEIPRSPAGTYTLTPTLAVDEGVLAAAGYAQPTPVPGTLVIDRAELVATADNQSRVYGTDNPVFTGTLTGVVMAGTGGDGITASYTNPTDRTTDAGTSPITPVLSDPRHRLSNYNVHLNSGTLTITRAPLTVNVDSKTRVYHMPDPAFTGTVGATLNGDVLTPTYSTTANINSPVGSYPIDATLSGAHAGSYTVTVNKGTLSITKMPTALAFTRTLYTSDSSGPASVQAVLTETLTGAPIAGQPISCAIGTTTVSGTTNAAGTATCTFTGLAVNSYAVGAGFAGDANYVASTATSSILDVYQATTFVIWGGNQPALADALTVGNTYQFWGDGWSEQVKAGDYHGGEFKGFACVVTATTWSVGHDDGEGAGFSVRRGESDGGEGNNGPRCRLPRTLPSYISVIVTTHVTRAEESERVSGNVAAHAVLRLVPCPSNDEHGQHGAGSLRGSAGASSSHGALGDDHEGVVLYAPNAGHRACGALIAVLM